MQQSLEATLDDKSLSFAILDENYKVTVHSTDSNPNRINREHFRPLLQGLLDQNGYGVFHKPIEYNGVVYSSYIRVDGYPYTILAGYNKAMAMKEFRETLLPGIIGYSVIGIVALIMLLALRKMIVKPVIRLSDIADRLSRGQEVRKIGGGRTYEINNLALQLMKVKRSLSREQKTRQKQRELLQIIRESDMEKESFLRELYHAMNTPLNLVIAGADLLKSRELGNNMDTYDQYFEMIYNAGRQLESYTTDTLNPSFVDVQEMISRCVVLQKKKASEIRITLNVHIDEDVQKIFADELRLRQVIISTLGQSIFCIQDFGKVNIYVEVQKKRSGKPANLIIRIEDDGLGVSEQQRIEEWERAFGNPDNIHSYSRNPDITRLSFPIIRHLVKLHHGTFEMKTTPRIGSIFTITIPYLTKKELETKPKNLNRASIKVPTSVRGKVANIIKFPGKD